MSARMARSEEDSLYAEMRHCGRRAGRRLRLLRGSGIPFNFLPRVARRSSPSCSSEPGLPFWPPADGSPFPPVEMLEFLANTTCFVSSCSFVYTPGLCLVSIAAVLVNHSFVQFLNCPRNRFPFHPFFIHSPKSPQKCFPQDKLLPWLWPCLPPLLRAFRETPAPRRRQPRPCQPWSRATSPSRLCLLPALRLQLLLLRRRQDPVMAPSTLPSCE